MPRSKQSRRVFAGLPVEGVEPGSPAATSGVTGGDLILEVDGVPVRDLVDFRYYSSEEQFELTLRRGEQTLVVTVMRDWGEEVGIRFAFELADGIHTCENKCVFCFIHQMPKGMRQSLYLMDDDYRLSFLHGYYVTLTNMSEEEFERTKQQRLSPLYVSVHSTHPRLRGFLLGRSQPEPILPRLRELIEAGIQVHAQVVVCPGLNDGPSLDRTVRELADLYPGVLSVAVVPVGLSKFRHNLYPLRRVDAEYSRALLQQMDSLRDEMRERLGTSFVFPSDEWFFYAGEPIPPMEWYEAFPQFDDGVGTCRVFLTQAEEGFASLGVRSLASRIHLVTAPLPSSIIAEFAGRLGRAVGAEVEVVVVPNDFFGRGITVAGLITGEDLVRTLCNTSPRGIVLVPDIALRDDRVFLDEVTIADVRRETGCDVRVCPSSARAFLGEFLSALV